MVRLICVALLSLSAAVFAEDNAAPETFLERPVSDAEKKQFLFKENLYFYKEDYAELREMFRKRKWGPEVVKVQLRRVAKKGADPEMEKISGYAGQKENSPFIYVAYLGETFYTGRIDEETKQKHHIRIGRMEVERLATIEQVRSEYAQKKWSPKIISVELLYGGMDILYPYIRPYVQITYLGDDKQAQAEIETARARIRKDFGIGKDVPNWKFRGGGNWSSTGIIDNFEHADKRKVEVLQIECENESAALHELLRPGIEFESDIVAMKCGPAIRSENPTPTAENKNRAQVRLSWLSGTNHVISISAIKADDSDPAREFCELLAEKFPSALKGDFKIDKTQWARDEVALRLRQMDAALKGSRDDFLENCTALSKVVWLPAWLVFKPDFDLNAQQRALQALNEWWAAEKEKYFWDRTLQRLSKR